MHTKVYFHESDVFSYEPISNSLMFIYVLSSYWFFNLINQTVHTSKGDRANWLKHNILLSFIHATICSILLLIAVCRAPEMFQDPLSHSNHFNYSLVAFTTGYFIYDLIDCIKNSTTSIFAFVIHHTLAILFFINVLFYTRNVGYALYGLAIEINSCFLHGRRLFRWYSPVLSPPFYNNLLRIFIEISNYFTFIVFRFGIVLIGIRAVCTQKDRLHPIEFWCILLASLAMAVLNIVLFYQLVRNQLVGKRRGKQIKQNNNNLPIVISNKTD